MSEVFDLEGTDSFVIDGLLIEQQFDGNGGHRLVIGQWKSDRASYRGISCLKYDNITICGTSESFGDLIPRVFKVIAGEKVRRS